jgi:F0F1-type ATP synthase assembly protein I
MKLPFESRAQMLTFGQVATVGLEMVLSVVVGYFAGRWLDGRLGTEPWLAYVGLGFGIAAGSRALYRVLRTVKKEMEKDAQETREA